MGTLVGLIILTALVTIACRSIYKDKKKGGGCASCGGSCQGCGGCR